MSRVVSYFTPEYQATAVEYLLPSLIQTNIPHSVRHVPSLQSWRSNTLHKSEFLLRMHAEFPEEGLLWVDVDARVYRNPFEFLESLVCDIGVHYLRGQELLSGTIWLPAVERREEILQAWHAENAAEPGRWDQKNLAAVLERLPAVNVLRLEPEYCFIFDISRKLHPHAHPIIEHFQASRTLKKPRKVS